MSWFKENILTPVTGAAKQLGQDALAGAVTGIVGGPAAANPDNVPRGNVVVGQTPTGAGVAGVENNQVGVPGVPSVFGYPSWAVALGSASLLLLAVAGTVYMVKS